MDIKRKFLLALGGFTAAFIIIEIILSLSGFFYYKSEIPAYDFSLASRGNYNIVCVGDSYTWGVGAGFKNSYPAQLESILNSQAQDKKFKVYNLGVPGYNSHQVYLSLKKSLDSFTPDLVIVLGGTNDYILFDNDLLFSLDHINQKRGSLLYRLKTVKLARIIKTNFKQWAKPTKDSLDAIKQIEWKDDKIAAPRTSSANKQTGRISEIVKQLDQDPSNQKLHALLDDILIKHNDIGYSIQVYTELLKKFPENRTITDKLASSYKHLAGSYLIDNKYQQAAKYYQQAAFFTNDKQKNKEYTQMIRHLTVFDFNCYYLKAMAELCIAKDINIMISGQPEFTLMPSEYIAKKYNIPLVRHGEKFKGLLENNPRDRFFISDGHCTKDGYKVIAENIAREIIENLK